MGLSQAKLAAACKVSQALISAYELGKSELKSFQIDEIKSLLSRVDEVAHLSTSPKRYREHRYEEIPILPGRIGKYGKSEGADKYLSDLKDISMSHHCKPKTLSALSLFAGGGGFSLGFSAAGFDIKGFSEIDPGVRNIYKSNFPDCQLVAGDVRLLSQRTLELFEMPPHSVDVVIGGPPCQGFSLAGKRDVNDSRNNLFDSYIDVVGYLKPKCAIIENVRTITSMRTPGGVLVRDAIESKLSSMGYEVALFELNASNYGVPQDRPRVIFMSFRKDIGIYPSLPPVEFDDGVGLFSCAESFRKFKDACSDLPYIESGGTSADPMHVAVNHPKHVVDWLWNVEEGKSAHDNVDVNLRPPSGYNTTYKRQVWDEPAATVQTTFGMISGCRNVHPVATRSLTVREAARIQSFPDSYVFKGNLGSVRTAIGNAVPPLLARKIADHVRSLII